LFKIGFQIVFTIPQSLRKILVFLEVLPALSGSREESLSAKLRVGHLACVVWGKTL